MDLNYLMIVIGVFELFFFPLPSYWWIGTVFMSYENKGSIFVLRIKLNV